MVNKHTQHSQHTRLSVTGPVECPYTGRDVLNTPALNKGSAFTKQERDQFDLHGLLPVHINTLDDQVSRAYQQFLRNPTDLAKNAFCTSLKDQNEVLYYKFLLQHISEAFGIIYTPTQGEAIENYSHEFRRPEGCFLDIDHPDQIEQRLALFGQPQDIDYIVVTDGESILGIGDQGTGGIGISVAKLTLMTLCAGIHPDRVVPVVLDTGTDRQTLLDDPLYMGNRFRRVRGQAYDDFMEIFVQSVKKLFPKAVLHFEDFGVKNARRILHKYQDVLPCFNDDIQGTGAVTLSAITAALKTLNTPIIDTRILIFGAGSAGLGIAEQITDHLVTKGLSYKEACSHIWLIDRFGLLTKESKGVSEGQLPYLVDTDLAQGINTLSLVDIIANFHPHILIGTSTQPGAFTEAAVKEMNKHVERPIIFPLSNPTRLHEAVPKDLLEWTQGSALVATGSPFPPVFNRIISENNNCFSFPGIGLGAVLCRASRITKNMIAASVDALSAISPILTDPNGGLLPNLHDIRTVSRTIAVAVIKQAVKDGIATVQNEKSPGTDEFIQIPTDDEALAVWVENQMWKPEYRPLHQVEEE
ncbi:uncharacterized protein SAPINGB_P004442 [Magnusiomyces paraingens]|uniref:Malic enzyme n=1 Tax=Magnusiomyces paraingens TaxID=2606893 RepID=A0A5E8BZL6_9ASCO|nr:uncharacterized protein SAPINGB_P004442 [Saprochaete ingens]VVT55130.1 unnamed protein product [Saprochaete ingens]